MKNISLLAVLLFAVSIFSQTPNWTSIKETNINVVNASSVDIFTNAYGNHIIVQESNALKYYKMDINGNAGTPTSIETESVISPSISGNASILYIVYRKSSQTQITAKVSTNGGSSWDYIPTNILNANSISIESVMSNNVLHVTYQLSNSVKYQYFEANVWSGELNVSANETGYFPRITSNFNSSSDTIYFYYRKDDISCNWRAFSMQSKQFGPINLALTAFSPLPAGLAVDKYKITFFCSYINPSPFQYRFFYVVRYKNNLALYSPAHEHSNQTERVYSTMTSNGVAHAAFWYNFYSGENFPGLHRFRSNASPYLDPIIQTTPPLPYSFVNISSSSNDVHVIWKDNLGNNNGNNLRYKYDDQAPLAPQNLTVTAETQSGYAHPKLTWTLNNEPDVYNNTGIAYRIERRFDYNGSGNWTVWSQIATKNGITSTFIDEGVNGSGNGPNYVQYRLKAQDIGGYQSAYSGVAGIAYGFFDKSSSITNAIKEYELEQNYPNPFNPTTKISWQSPISSRQTIKIYDVLGNVVATLIDEFKPAGKYEVDFNANNLPSGMYFYKLEAGKFTSVKKMLLVR